jgi:outer membrane protein assembly factor BamB
MGRFVFTIFTIVIVLSSRFAAVGQEPVAPKPSSPTPAFDVLDKFTAADVPATGPAEIPADPPLEKLVKTTLSLSNLPGKGLAQHPMLYIGEGYNTMLLVKDGKVIWTYSTGKGWEYDDIWLLSNGNILFSRMQYAAEVTPQKKVVWRLDAPKGAEIHSVQPIGLDKVFVMQNGLPPKLMIVNKKTGAVEVSHELAAPSPAGPGGVHGQFRRGRITAAGTYLVPWLVLGKVVEYDKDFKEIWSYDIPSPWAAVRLKNGNTLITNEKQQLTREVNPKGETVWEFKLSELPRDIVFKGSQSCVRLANGNTILCSRGDGGKGCQAVEVMPDKKVVWALYDWKHLGPCTAVQILDDPGVPERPGDLQR